MAIAHKLALIIYRNLSAGRSYVEPPPKPMSDRAKRRIRDRRVAELERLGYKVTVEKLETAS
jgi:hypothetical protein